MRFTLTILLCAAAARLPGQSNLDLKGHPAGELNLRQGFEFPIAWTDEKTPRVRQAPFYCSACAADAPDISTSDLPRPTKLFGRPLDSMIGSIKGKKKWDPVVVRLADHVLVCDLRPVPQNRFLSKAEKEWFVQHGGGVPKRFSTHDLAHLWAMRVAQVQYEWDELFGLRPGALDAKPLSKSERRPSGGLGEIYLLDGEEPYREWCRQFLPILGVHATWTFGHRELQVITILHGGDVPDDILHARLDHMMAHHLLCEYRSFEIPLPLWLMEGLGHVFERRHEKFEATICKLGNPKPGQKDDGYGCSDLDWWGQIRSIVAAGKEVPLGKLALRDTRKTDFPIPEQIQAWSLVSFMIGLGEGRFRAFVDTVKRPHSHEHPVETQARAIQGAFGVPVGEFEEAWRTWVKTTRAKR